MSIVRSRYQLPLSIGRIIVRDAPVIDALTMDVVFVGGGPAGIAGAKDGSSTARVCIGLSGRSPIHAAQGAATPACSAMASRPTR